MTDLISDINEAKERRLSDLYAAAISGIKVVPNPQLRGNQKLLMVSREIYEELMNRYGEPDEVESAMTDRNALIALRDTVMAGQWDHSPNGVVRKVFPYQSASIDDLGLYALEAFNGSVDAAIALLEAVLPGAPFWVETSFWVETKTDGIHHAGVFIPNLGRTFKAEAPNLGRALLIATLNALIAESN